MPRSAIQQSFIESKISEALSRHGVDYNATTLREELEKDAEIIGIRNAAVVVRGGSIDYRIAELRCDPRFESFFPADSPKISRTDLEKMRANFNAIAAGTVKVS
jgi:hypothetical protein